MALVSQETHVWRYQGCIEDGVIFAALQRSRAMKSPSSLSSNSASMHLPIWTSANNRSRIDTKFARARSSGGLCRDRTKPFGPPRMPLALGARTKPPKVCLASPPDLLFLLFWRGTTGCRAGGERNMEVDPRSNTANEVNEHADKCVHA